MTGKDPTQSLQSRALRHLARKAYSRAELRDRLRRWGTDPEVEHTLQILEQLGILNDPQTAYNSALGRLRNDGWGVIRVRTALIRRGFSKAVVAGALERATGETSEAEALETYLDRRFGRTRPPANRGAIFRLYEHLRRRGFRSDLVAAALRRRIPSSSWIDIETGE